MDQANLHVVAGLGAVGRAVVGELAARGLAVRAVARHRPSDLPAGIDVVQADVTIRRPHGAPWPVRASCITLLRRHMTVGPRSCRHS